MNGQLKLRCITGFRSRLFWGMLLGVAALAYKYVETWGYMITQWNISIFEAVLYGLSDFYVAVYAYIPIFLVAVAGQLMLSDKEWYSVPRSGTGVYIKGQIVVLALQAAAFMLGIVIGCAFVPVIAHSTYGGQVSFLNEWAIPGMFMGIEDLNMYYDETVLFALSPMAAAAVQAVLLMAWMYFTSLLALFMCMAMKHTIKGVVVTLSIHLIGIAAYYAFPAGMRNLLSFYDSFFLIEYQAGKLGLCILRLVLTVIAVTAACFASARLMKRLSWESLVKDK